MRRFLSLFLLVVLFLLVCPQAARTQYSGRNTWHTYSALNEVQGLAFDGDSVLWGATTGGLVAYYPASDSFDVYRNTEGLLSLNSTAVGVDPSTGAVYVGGANGSISIRHRDGSWSYSNVVATATTFPERSITGFGFNQGRVFILTRFGGFVYNPDDSTVGDSFVKFGTLPRNTPVNDILFWKESIWLATDRGIVSTSITNDNLAAPNLWVHYSATDSFQVLSLEVLDGQLLFGTRSRGAWILETDSGLREKRDDLPQGRINLVSNGSTLLAASEFGLYRRGEGSTFEQITLATDEIQAIATVNDRVVVGLRRKGFGVLQNDSLLIRLPNAPLSNSFVDLALDANGAIWTAHRAFGLSRLAEDRWTAIEGRELIPPLPSVNTTWNISSGASGAIWAGARANAGDTQIDTYDKGGVTVFTPVDTGYTYTHYNSTNSPITDVKDIPNYQVVGKAVGDFNGRTWFVNWDNRDVQGTSGPVLVVRLRPDETAGNGSPFRAFNAPFNRGRAYRWLVIDDNGTKWLGASECANCMGLLYYNDRGTIDDPADDDVGPLTKDQGLPSNTITALAVDPDGLLWIGTPSGLTVLVNPVSVVNNDQPPSFSPARPVKDVPITAIAVDALNRKWVGTSQGVFVLNFDGTEVVERYTAENSPLVDDAILSILADDATGDVYIGTVNGLSRVSTPAVEPPADAVTLQVFPQPFILPSADPLRIEGLPASATVKVLTLSGSLVREIPSPGGGVAFWDGLDAQGVLAPTGVYLIAAGSGVGNQTVVGKIAVIRR